MYLTLVCVISEMKKKYIDRFSKVSWQTLSLQNCDIRQKEATLKTRWHPPGEYSFMSLRLFYALSTTMYICAVLFSKSMNTTL